MQDGFFVFPLGNFQCTSLSDGGADYQLEAMVKNAPRAEVEEALRARGLPVDTIYTPYTNLVVDTGRHRVLVDMGMGSQLAPTAGRLLDNMRNAGIPPESIDTVFITHAHPDHVGGAIDAQGDPVFTEATYYICKAEWDFWFSTDAPTMAGEKFTAIAREKLAPLQKQTVLVEREGEVLPGVSVLFAPGHTPGHMVAGFSSHGEGLLYTADTVLYPLHLEHPDWSPVFDVLPDQAATSKRRIFDMASATNSWVMAQHFPPFPSLGHVIKSGRSWEWRPVMEKIR